MIEGLPVTWIDIAVLIVIGVSTIVGILRGFASEVFSIIAWLGGIFSALYLYEIFSPFIIQFITIKWISNLTSGFAIFIITTAVLTMLLRHIGNRINQSSLGVMNRTLGLVFGIARGWIIVCFIYLATVWVLTLENLPTMVKDARSKPFIHTSSVVLLNLAPINLRRRALEALKQARNDVGVIQSLKENYDKLARPTPKANNSASKDDAQGYSNAQRSDLEQILNQNLQ